MLCKPPFILFSNNNSSKSKPMKQENKLNLIFKRIPGSVLREKPEIEKIVYPNQKITYDAITNKKKPINIEITNNMSDRQEKIVYNLNSFKEMLYDFNQEGDELLENFNEVQEENEQFSHNYKKIQKDKSKFITGTYLDHDYLINIASKYTDRGIKVPKISSEKSVFAGNPLILGGSELEDFIVYNLGDRKKSGLFLKKVENLVRRKETGNYILNDAERKRFEFVLSNEKPKGYIPPDILIPKLKNDIITCKNACKNVKKLNKFLEGKKDNNNNKRIFSSLLNSPRIESKKNLNDIFDNKNKGQENNNKITFKKKLSFLENFNKNKVLNKNNSDYKIKNHVSSKSTGAYLSNQISSENSKRIFSSKLLMSRINSGFSRNKSPTTKFSPLPSPIYRNNNFSNKINFSLINELFSGKRRNNNNNSNSSAEGNNKVNKNINRILSMNSIDINRSDNIKKDRIFSVNHINKLKKSFSLGNNSIDYKFNKRTSLSKITSNNMEKSDNKNNNFSKDEISEENEFKILNEELRSERKEEESKKGNKGEAGLKRNININILDNNFDKISPKIDKNNVEKEEETSKRESTKLNIDLSMDPEKKKKLENSIRTEKIYNSIIGEESNSRRVDAEIDDFLKSKGYDISKRVLNKDAYINIIKAKKIMSERNFLLEEYNIRSGDVGKKFLTSKQRKILDKNDNFLKKMEENEYRFKKILLEKNIEKVNEDHED